MNKKKIRESRIKKTKKLIIKGLTIKEISKELKLSEDTIISYLDEINKKSNFVQNLWDNCFYFWNTNKFLFSIFSILILAVTLGVIILGYSFVIIIRDSVKILYEMLYNVLSANLEGVISIDVIIGFTVLLILYIFIAGSIKLIYMLKPDKKFNFWFFNTIFMIVFFLIIGIFFISEATTQSLDFGLNDENKNLTRANIDLMCEGESKRLLYNTEYNCYLKDPKIEENITLKNLTGSILFRDDNSTSEDFFNNSISFKVPVNTSYLLIKVNGNYKNESVSWSSGRPFNFITKDQEKEVKQDFLKNLFILFTLVFFSIPTMMLNFKKLMKDKD